MSLSECRIFKKQSNYKQDMYNHQNTSINNLNDHLCKIEDNKMEQVIFSPKCKNIQYLRQSSSQPLSMPSLQRKNSNKSNIIDVDQSIKTTENYEGRQKRNISTVNKEDCLQVIISPESLSSLIEKRRTSEQQIEDRKIDKTISIDSMLNNLNDALKTINI